MKLLILLALCSCSLTVAFLPFTGSSLARHATTGRPQRPQEAMQMTQRPQESSASGDELSRRGLLQSTTAALLSAVAASSLQLDPALAAGKPIAVLGANGSTGILCVAGLIARGKPVRAITRSGALTKDLPDKNEALLSVVEGDVSKPELLKKSLEGSGGVIFASSANFIKGTSTTVDVDNIGVINTAKACVELGIPQLVVISAGTVSRPKSFGYIATNLIGNIMAEKYSGELGLKEVYAGAPSSVSYTIVRPGGLDGKPKPVSALELNQGDTIGGIISRENLADVCIEALSNPSTKGTTFELYETKGRAPVQGRFPKVSGFERNGNTFPELFTGLVPDSELKPPQ
ncbi:unnamed protein product [Chrysoparadoxa australica]